MINKQLVKKEYIYSLEQKLEKARSSYEVAKRDTIEAEGRMITRYDSSKTETAWLADGCLQEVKNLEQCIYNVKTEKKFVNVSDIVTLDLLINKKYQKTLQYTLSRTGEDKIPETLFEKILGCFMEDSVVINESKQQMEYRVKDIRKVNDNSTVSIESLVTVTDEYGESKYYITNYLGGIDLQLENEEIFCISKQAPIAKALLGKGRGENITMSVKENFVCTIKDFE